MNINFLQNMSDVIFEVDAKENPGVVEIFGNEPQSEEFWCIVKNNSGQTEIKLFFEWTRGYEEFDGFETCCNQLCRVFIKLNVMNKLEISNKMRNLLFENTDGCAVYPKFSVTEQKTRTTYFFNYHYKSNIFYFTIEKVSPAGYESNWGKYDEKIKNFC